MQITNNWIYFQADKATARSLDAIWVQSKQLWKLPNTLGALRELYQSTKNTNVLQYGTDKAHARSELLRLKAKQDASGDPRLRPYQRVDVQYLSTLDHCGLFNEQRTGKSPTALFTLVNAATSHNIIVCPASLLLNWRGEIEKWLNNVTVNVHVVKGSKQQRQKIYTNFLNSKKNIGEMNFLIISYETLRNDTMVLVKSLQKETYSVTVDEAHRLANPKSKQSKAVFNLGKHAAKRLALTGTPTQNNGIDIFGILHFLYPTRFTSYWQFAERYFQVYDGWHGGKEIGTYKRRKELVEIIETISTQRKRAEVMAWLPKKQYLTYTVEPSSKQKRVYQDVLKTFEYEQDGEIIVDAPSVLAQLTRLRQITLHPGLVGADAPSAKEEWLKEFINDNPGERIVIFTNFTSYIKRLEKELKGAVSLHGQMSAEQKNQSVRTFQQGEKGTHIILCNIKTAATGWTLDQATTTIFLDRSFNNTENLQAEDRMISTQQNNVSSNTIIDVVLADSVDKRINDILKQKKSVTEVINNYKGLKELLS